MPKYVSTIAVPHNLTIGDFDAFMERLRELAGAEVVKHDGHDMPEEIELTFDDEDQWDLYLTVRQVEENVASYLDVTLRIPKPRLKGD